MLMITDVFQTYSNVYGCFWMQAMQVQFLHGMLVPDVEKIKVGCGFVYHNCYSGRLNSLNNIVPAL